MDWMPCLHCYRPSLYLQPLPEIQQDLQNGLAGHSLNGSLWSAETWSPHSQFQASTDPIASWMKTHLLIWQEPALHASPLLCSSAKVLGVECWAHVCPGACSSFYRAASHIMLLVSTYCMPVSVAAAWWQGYFLTVWLKISTCRIDFWKAVCFFLKFFP